MQAKKQPIENLSLSTRTYTTLHEHGIRYVEDLMQFKTEEDLLKLKNIGPAKAKELINIINRLKNK